MTQEPNESIKRILLDILMPYYIPGLITGAALGLLPYWYNSNTAQSHLTKSEQANLPLSIDEDKAFIMVYADGIDGRSYRLPTPTSEYFRFKQRNHTIRDYVDYTNFVTYDNKTVKGHAESLTSHLSSQESKAQLLLDFVHSHIYDKSIEEKADYVRYPLETMVERNGDCEDLAILGAGLMKSIGLDVALVVFPREGEKAGHAGVGVNGNFSGHYFNVEGKKYFYAETTGTNWLTRPAKWKIGDLPPDFNSRPVNIYIIK